MKILESYLIAFALMNACGRRTTDIFTILFFGVTYLLLGNVPKVEKRKDCVLSVVCSVAFTSCYVLGNSEALSGGLANKLFWLFYMGCTIIGLLCLFYRVVSVLLVNSTRVQIYEEPREFSAKMFWMITGIVFCCMLPFLLTNFPAIMTPDSLSQYRQTIGIENYSDHHPWMHTLVFKLFYEIGFAITHDTYLAIACYTLVQMLLVAASIAYVWTALYEMGLKKNYCFIGVTLFIVYPYNLVYGVTIWKDVLFAMSVVVLTLTIFRMHVQMLMNDKVQIREWVLYVGCGFFMCMLRHNGFYAFLVASPILLYCFRKKWKYVLPATVLVLLTCFLIKGPVMTAANVEPGQFAYKLCVPLQQIGRVVADGCELTEEEIVAIGKINDISYVKENYQKHGADNMTSWVTYGNQDYLEEHIGEYIDLWVSLGIRYPGKYVQAYVDLTKGYWYPMDPEQVVFWGITENAIGLESQPILKGPIVVKVHEILTKLYTIFPLYGIMYSMGAVFWVFILLLAISIRNNNSSMWIASVPLLLLTCTLFVAVPLVADLRYGYPLMVGIPSVVAFTFFNTREDTNEEFYE